MSRCNSGHTNTEGFPQTGPIAGPVFYALLTALIVLMLKKSKKLHPEHTLFVYIIVTGYRSSF